MNQHYDAFRKKLQEIFMMDHAELDFGIYRIMNHKRNQINDFLDKQLLPQVEQTLKEYVKTDDSLQQELNKAIEGCKNLGIDPDTNPKVQELQEADCARKYKYRRPAKYGFLTPYTVLQPLLRGRRFCVAASLQDRRQFCLRHPL